MSRLPHASWRCTQCGRACAIGLRLRVIDRWGLLFVGLLLRCGVPINPHRGGRQQLRPLWWASRVLLVGFRPCSLGRATPQTSRLARTVGAGTGCVRDGHLGSADSRRACLKSALRLGPERRLRDCTSSKPAKPRSCRRLRRVSGRLPIIGYARYSPTGAGHPSRWRCGAGSQCRRPGPITGESRPEDVAEGARVYAGTLNVSGLLELVIGLAGDSVLGRVAAMLQRAMQGHNGCGPWSDWVQHTSPSCWRWPRPPCSSPSRSIGPLRCWWSFPRPWSWQASGDGGTVLGHASRHAHQGCGLEIATSLDTLVIDKTGTLTTGELVVHVSVVDGGVREEVLRVAATWAWPASVSAAAMAGKAAGLSVAPQV